MSTERIINPEEQGKSFAVKYDESVPGYGLLKVESSEEFRQIPVYSIRNPDHHKLIAKSISSGAPGAFEAAGVIGILIAVKDSRAGDDSYEQFWKIKRGRQSQDKVPMMLPPRHQWSIVDFDELHPDFRYLKDSKNREKFYGQLPLHVIWPFKETASNVNRKAFVTTKEDYDNKPEDQRVGVSTVCIYFQDDEDWRRVAEFGKRFNPHVFFGISSFNDHGEQPPFDFEELMQYVRLKQRVDFDYVIRDSIATNANIKSSHTQIRPPLWYESPEIRVVRRGPVSAETISAHTGHPVITLKSARLASRGHPEDVNLDPNVFKYINDANLHIQQRKKSKRHEKVYV